MNASSASTNAPLPAADPLAGLPTLGGRPRADVVVFDGHCRFCLAQVRRLRWFDRGGRLAYLSLHDPEVARRFPDLTHAQLMAELYVIDQSGVRRGGAAAIRYLCRRLPLLWPLAPLLHVPGSLPVWRWLYRQVALRRYWLAGRLDGCDDGACAVHFKR